MQAPISISNISSISALGTTPKTVWQSYLQGKPLFTSREGVWVSCVSSEIEQELQSLQKTNNTYKNLDRAVLFAILSARKAQGIVDKVHIGINIGSSRGATTLFEKYHQQFQATGKVSPFSSPTTTLGNISSWVSQDLGVEGIQIDHSVTCSTAMHAILNGIAWLHADMADAFLVGGSEAAITPFTLAQIQALKLYSTSLNIAACESMNFQKKSNTMVLGEGAAVAVLEKGVSENTQAIISGYGFASETLVHNSSISENADCFQKSMTMALKKAELQTVDAIVMHAPGTVKGDLAEKNAIDLVFQDKVPLLTSNKWLLGHTFGASGMMSVEMAVLMLHNNIFIENPFFSYSEKQKEIPLRHIMVNAVGFGGNAVSIVLSKHVSLPLQS